MNKDLQKFINEFNIVDNGLKMRQLIRWNGRDVSYKENLAEHTHLVVACVIHLVEELKSFKIYISDECEHLAMKLAMIHDSLELLRGDILSITKDAIPNLREHVDAEEKAFMMSQCDVDMSRNLLKNAQDILELADLMACYKFLEAELRYPNNDFVKEIYVSCKEKFDDKYEEFLNKNGFCLSGRPAGERFQKGYLEDAGVDIVLDKRLVFLPMGTTSVNLNIQITPNEGEMSFICARTSAAAKGLIVATCPIDPNFVGTVTAIVHNVSNDIIIYDIGESFCQYVTCKIITNKNVNVKREGKRSTSKLGGTDVSSN